MTCCNDKGYLCGVNSKVAYWDDLTSGEKLLIIEGMTERMEEEEQHPTYIKVKKKLKKQFERRITE